MTVHERPYRRYFEEFEVGDVYRHWPGKTITEADDHLFCMLTMNHHPVHTNDWFASHDSPVGRNLVVGNLVYSLVLGMSVADVSGSAVANLEVESLRHPKPTFHGDTIWAETRVAADLHRTEPEAFAASMLIPEEPGRRVDFVEGVTSYVEKRPPAFRPLPPRGTSLEGWPSA